jgi:hypothetical protein
MARFQTPQASSKDNPNCSRMRAQLSKSTSASMARTVWRRSR